MNAFNEEYSWQLKQISSYKYFICLINELENSYIDQDFSQIDQSFFEEFQFAYDILVQELILRLESKIIDIE